MTYLHITSKRFVRTAVASLFIAAQIPFALAGTVAAEQNSSQFNYKVSGGSETSVENETEVSISNSTSQEAYSGGVEINHAKNISDVSTGDVSNENVTVLAVTVETDNDVPAPSVPQSSHHKKSQGSQSTKVENKTQISISNSTSQYSETGSVHIANAKRVSDVSTGDASNQNCTDIGVIVLANVVLHANDRDACDEDDEEQPPVTPPSNGNEDDGSVLGDSTQAGGQGGGAVLAASTELANTGAETLLGLLAALTLIGTVSYATVASRKQ